MPSRAEGELMEEVDKCQAPARVPRDHGVTLDRTTIH